MKKIGIYLFILLFFCVNYVSAESLATRLKGKIILKVEDSGKAYYINPANESVNYLGRPEDAFSVMREQGVGITNQDLYKIPIGVNNSGVDSDGDGLADNLEDAIGLDMNKGDTDGDGYSDKDELENGYSPWGVGKQNIDNNFADKQKGKILLQIEKNGEAWYINPGNSKRYFLGRPDDAFEVMRNLGLGISNNNFALLSNTPTVVIDEKINKIIEDGIIIQKIGNFQYNSIEEYRDNEYTIAYNNSELIIEVVISIDLIDVETFDEVVGSEREKIEYNGNFILLNSIDDFSEVIWRSNGAKYVVNMMISDENIENSKEKTILDAYLLKYPSSIK